MNSVFPNRNAIITRKILNEIAIALEKHGANTKSVQAIKTRWSVNRISEAAERLNAPRVLRGFIGSWGDTLTDEEVLEGLHDWNQKAIPERDVTCPNCDTHLVLTSPLDTIFMARRTCPRCGKPLAIENDVPRVA